MKKAFAVIFCLIFSFAQVSFANSSQSQNNFAIRVVEAPSGDISKEKKGLSDGAISAIVLGSTFGGLGVLSGIGYYFYKNSKCNLKAGLVCGKNSPYQTLNNSEFLNLICKKEKYFYLMKAKDEVKSENSTIYLVIPDTKIEAKTFDTIFFELREFKNGANFRIVQSTKPFEIKNNIPNINSDIFINPKENDVEKIPTSTEKIANNNGILIKKGTIKPSIKQTLGLTIQNNSEKEQIYAIIVEFKNN